MYVGRGTVACVATRYVLDGAGNKSQWNCDNPHPNRAALGATQPSTQWVTGNSHGVKRPGRGLIHTRNSVAEVKKRVELYF